MFISDIINVFLRGTERLMFSARLLDFIFKHSEEGHPFFLSAMCECFVAVCKHVCRPLLHNNKTSIYTLFSFWCYLAWESQMPLQNFFSTYRKLQVSLEMLRINVCTCWKRTGEAWTSSTAFSAFFLGAQHDFIIFKRPAKSRESPPE